MSAYDPLADVDPAAMAEQAAKRAEAFDEAKAAALSGDWQPARQLDGLAREAAERTEADNLADRIAAAPDVAALAALAPRGRVATCWPAFRSARRFPIPCCGATRAARPNRSTPGRCYAPGKWPCCPALARRENPP